MTIYISGPITGKENENREAFSAAQAMLESNGHVVLNPHVICADIVASEIWRKASASERWVMCMRECLRRLPDADLVYALDGWQLSSGARKEISVARWLEIPVYLQTGGEL